MDRHWPHRHASRHAKPGSYFQDILKRDPHAGDLYIFRGRRGDLVKVLWHDGLGMSLYAKRLDRGKFIWPSASAGAVSISAAMRRLEESATKLAAAERGLSEETTDAGILGSLNASNL
ncbi:IS66 family insertion sequence element accessory protein TnpB [Bradyrhizobium sp. NDS-1]|uniref:IS66 family insertion sequence element accessory protein TnpB n=1 Tax=Bradyrhizobium sp. NDS-1 TaxID=3080014 RepID=UPI00293E06A8|nr:IS66 family insertion sequence element accessory protein TnpB [Bradyrhizobium sp. NDS-1]WOH75628.1 IS66 family insertion sequence element accessory protein TnpB [Bradyrhizobium sp. NDS-1]